MRHILWIILVLLFVVGGITFLITRRRKRIAEQRWEKEEGKDDEGESKEDDDLWVIGTWSIGGILFFIISAIVGFLMGRFWFGVASVVLAFWRVRGGYAQNRLSELLRSKGMLNYIISARAAIAASSHDPAMSLEALTRLREKIDERSLQSLVNVYLEAFHDSVSDDWSEAVQRALEASASVAQGRARMGDTLKKRFGESLFVSGIGFAAVWILLIGVNKYITPASEGMLIALLAGVAGIFTLLDEMTNV